MSSPDDDAISLADSELQVWYHVFMRSFRMPRALQRWRAYAIFRKCMRLADAHRRRCLLASSVQGWRAAFARTQEAYYAAADHAFQTVQMIARICVGGWHGRVVARRRRLQLLRDTARTLSQRRYVARWREFCAYRRQQKIGAAAYTDLIDFSRQKGALNQLRRCVKESHRALASEDKMRKFVRCRRLLVALRGWVYVTRVTFARAVARHHGALCRRHLLHWWSVLRALAQRRYWILRTGLTHWRVISASRLHAQEVRANQKIRKFQVRAIRRWVSAWRGLVQMKRKCDKACAQRVRRVARRAFRTWCIRKRVHKAVVRIKQRVGEKCRRSVLGAWLQWAHHKRALFLQSVEVKAHVRTRLLRRMTHRWERKWKSIGFTKKNASAAIKRRAVTAMESWRLYVAGKVRGELNYREAVCARYHVVLRLYFQAMKVYVPMRKALRFRAFCHIQQRASYMILLTTWHWWMRLRPALRRNFLLPQQQYLAFLLRRTFGLLHCYWCQRVRVRRLKKEVCDIRATRSKRFALETLADFAGSRRRARDNTQARSILAERVVRHARMRQVFRVLFLLVQDANHARQTILLAWGFQRKWLVHRACLAWNQEVYRARQRRKNQQWTLHCGIFHRQKRVWFQHWLACAEIQRWDTRFGRAATVLWYAHTLRRSFCSWLIYRTQRVEKKHRQKLALHMWHTWNMRELVPRLFRCLVEIEEANEKCRLEAFEQRWAREQYLSKKVWIKWRQYRQTRLRTRMSRAV